MRGVPPSSERGGGRGLRVLAFGVFPLVVATRSTYTVLRLVLAWVSVNSVPAPCSEDLNCTWFVNFRAQRLLTVIKCMIQFPSFLTSADLSLLVARHWYEWIRFFVSQVMLAVLIEEEKGLSNPGF